MDGISKIGVATNDQVGNTVVYVCDVVNSINEWNLSIHNSEDW